MSDVVLWPRVMLAEQRRRLLYLDGSIRSVAAGGRGDVVALLRQAAVEQRLADRLAAYIAALEGHHGPPESPASLKAYLHGDSWPQR